MPPWAESTLRLWPKRLLELVLDVEHPDFDGGGEQHDWRVHKQKRSNADESHGGEHQRDDCRIGSSSGSPMSISA